MKRVNDPIRSNSTSAIAREPKDKTSSRLKTDLLIVVRLEPRPGVIYIVGKVGFRSKKKNTIRESDNSGGRKLPLLHAPSFVRFRPGLSQSAAKFTQHRDLDASSAKRVISPRSARKRARVFACVCASSAACPRELAGP